MYVDKDGLHLDDKELRSFLVLKVGFINWKCGASCLECHFHNDEGYCVIGNVEDEFDELFRGLIL